MPMPIETPTPLDRYHAARDLRVAAAAAFDAAQHAHFLASEVCDEARYVAVTAVACPYCKAPVGERCHRDDGNFHRNVTHGVRDDLSGVNGPRSQQRAEQDFLSD